MCGLNESMYATPFCLDCNVKGMEGQCFCLDSRVPEEDETTETLEAAFNDEMSESVTETEEDNSSLPPLTVA